MHQLLLIIAVSQTLFATLIIILGRKEGASRSAILLGGFIFLYGLSFLPELKIVSELNRSTPALVPLVFFFYFLIGPCFYFYIKEITQKQGQPLVTNWPLHVFPIVLGVGLMSAWVLIPEDSRRMAISHEFWPVNRPMSGPEVSILIAQIVSHAQLFAYFSASFLRLKRHLSNVRELFSNLENKTLGWARIATCAIFAIWFIDFVTDIGYLVGWFGGAGEVVFTGVELLIFYFVTIYGLRQPAIFGDKRLEDSSGLQSNSTPANKYLKSALTGKQMERISENLDRAMTSDKLFADSSLTLADLSRSIHTPQNYVSQTLNQKIGLKFYDYIAQHRIEEAKALLRETDSSKTVLQIALDVGFNSKSTFNAAFKRLVGVTPSQFRSQQRECESGEGPRR
jgi:AraC-like DNA-binding protein